VLLFIFLKLTALMIETTKYILVPCKRLSLNFIQKISPFLCTTTMQEIMQKIRVRIVL